MASESTIEQAPERDPMGRHDLPVLRGIGQSTDLTQQTGIPRALFMPTNYSEAIEMAKMMCAGVAVPDFLRGSPANCLAVLMQASRWGLDPYAVAGKSYFVNDRIAYEAQLVDAVVNTSKVLHSRLHVWWEGQDNSLRCFVEGHIVGEIDPRLHSQAIAKVKVRNSPLWQVNPEQQLAYLTKRAWARLYIPEVLLGVYTPDELADQPRALPPSSRSERIERTFGEKSPDAPPSPTRSQFGAEAITEATGERAGASDGPREHIDYGGKGAAAAQAEPEPEGDDAGPSLADQAADHERRRVEEAAAAEADRLAEERQREEEENRVDDPAPEGFETWEAWQATIVSKMKVAPNLPKLDKVTAEHKVDFDRAPARVKDVLRELYDEKRFDHLAAKL